MPTFFIRCFVALTLLLPTLAWSADDEGQRAYVSDELRVGVREAPGSRAAPMAIVRSGDVVSVLERRRGYLKIRTANGVTGWVKAAYITSKVPTATRLAEKVKELTFLKQKLAQLDEQTAKVSDTLAAMQRRIDTLQQENATLKTHLAQARQRLQASVDLPPLARFTHEMRERPWWMVAVGGMLLFLAVGFLVGVYWYRHQVSKRLGGFTI